MSPDIEVGVRNLPREVADTLSKKEKGRLFQKGEAFLVDFGTPQITCTFINTDDLTSDTIESCVNSDTKYLFRVPPASTPQSLREKKLARYGSHTLETARLTRGGRK